MLYEALKISVAIVKNDTCRWAKALFNNKFKNNTKLKKKIILSWKKNNSKLKKIILS